MSNHLEEPRALRGVVVVGISVMLVLGTLFLVLPSNVQRVRAASLQHDVGNVDLRASDDGRIEELYWNGVRQTAVNPTTGLDYIGLVIDHDGYDHFNTGNPPDDFDGIFLSDFMEDSFSGSDFNNVVVPVHYEENTAQKQETSTRYNHTAYDIWDTNVPRSEIYDLDVEQTAWTVANEDWAIIRWDVINTRPWLLSNVYVGFYMAASSFLSSDNGGIGGDSNDESNGWNNGLDCDDGLWLQDSGSMTTMALAPAVSTLVFDQCYVTSNDGFLGPFMPDDETLWTASDAPNQLEPAGGAEDKYLMVGWNVGDIAPGFMVSLPLVIAFNDSVAGAQNEVDDARNFYFIETLPVMVTEFQDEPTVPNPQRIEIYNDMGTSLDLVANSFGFSTLSYTQLSGTWSPTTVPPYSHAVFQVDASTPLGTEGDIIRLKMGNLVIDEFGYGQYGKAPDPMSGQSAARVWNTPSFTYGDDWTMTLPTNNPPFDNAPTWGIQNSVPPVISNPGLVLNEVAFDPSVSCGEGYIELMYIFDSGLIDFSFSNHRIVVDSLYSVTGGTVSPLSPYAYLMETGYPAQFDLDYAGDNVYLFNSTGSLLDMTGWDSLHSPGSMGRMPEGAGTHAAFDDATATGAGWEFLPKVTYIDNYISIGKDQSGGADPSSDATYNLTVRNLQASPDDISLSSTSQLGWPVTFYYDAVSWVPINDGDSGNPGLAGDTLPDFTIGASTTVTIAASVSVPMSTLLISETENTTVWAESYNQRLSCPPGNDAARLFTQVFPYLQIEKAADPGTFWMNGAGSPDWTDVNLTIRGAGAPQIVHKPQDVVFLIDSSGSMAWNDPAYLRLTAVNGYMQDMIATDRSAIAPFGHDYDIEPNVVCICIAGNWVCSPSFVPTGWITDDMVTPSSPAKVPHHLTWMDPAGKATMATDLQTIGPPDQPLIFDDPVCGTLGPGTNIEHAMQFAHEELIPGYAADPTTTWFFSNGLPQVALRTFPPPAAKGDPNHIWVEILVTDGLPSHPTTATDDEVAVAAANGVKMYTVGLLGPLCATNPIQCAQAEAYLQQIATLTGAKYYYADDPSDLIGIYDDIGTEIKNIAASPPQTPTVAMVTDVLPDYVELVPGSIWVDTGTFTTSGCSPPGGVCTIQWDVTEDISIGEEHWMTYQIKANVPSPPNWNITKKPEAAITYTNWRGNEVTSEVPDVFVTVLSPQLQPPYVTDMVVAGTELNITWNLSPSLNVNAYDVYGGPTQTSVDFGTVIASTPDEPAPAGRTWVQFAHDFASYPEYYFVVRARNNAGGPEWSPSSNTAGYYTIDFGLGLNTFSPPLKPFGTVFIEDYLAGIQNALSISYLDVNDDWQTIVPPALPPFTSAQVGTGYVLETSNVTSHIFTGEPGSMIWYLDGFSWDYAAGSLVSASRSGNDITLSWPSLGGGIQYYIYRSQTRDGFFPGSPGTYSVLNGGNPVPGTIYVDIGAAASPPDYYYMILPYNTGTSELGSGTYSVGVVKDAYNGNEMIGLPLKPQWGDQSADWYADRIPGCLGIVYLEAGVWKAHFKEFPQGVYDPILTMGSGYEISVNSPSSFIFVGW